MKKTALLLTLILALSGCSKKADIDELISARELPEYADSVEIEVIENTNNTDTSNSEVIVIDE